MIYIILIILTFFMMGLNWKLLDIPGFFYYSSVRPILKEIYREKLLSIEKLYYWEIVGSVGTMASLSLLPTYIFVFDLLQLAQLWLEITIFIVLNYMWWFIYAFKQIRLYVPRIPEQTESI